MQAIVVPDASFDRTKHTTDFIKAAIFPGGCLPSVGALTAAATGAGGGADLSLVHLDDLGPHYAETLAPVAGQPCRGPPRPGCDSVSTNASPASGTSTSPTARPASTSAT